MTGGRRGFSDLTVVIPTLNECDNIDKVISVLKGLYEGVHIIVSDDGSTDGTIEKVRSIARRDGNVRLLDRRDKEVKGLTASVVDAALMADTRKIVLMDADLQHPPELVGEIARKLDDYDLCIGVRTVVKRWGFHRRLLSKGISYFSFFVFKLRGKITCDDMMSGFFGIRTALFTWTINRNRRGFVYKGYKVLLDTMRMLDKNETRVKELPYSTFHDRASGSSKLTLRHMAEVVVSTLN